MDSQLVLALSTSMPACYATESQRMSELCTILKGYRIAQNLLSYGWLPPFGVSEHKV
jgi:hypothetical protein